MVPSRRQYIVTTGIALTGLAGCLGLGDPDLVVENQLEQSVTVDVDVTRMSDMRVVVQEEESIGAGETTEFLDPFDEPSEYRIQILAGAVNTGGEKTVEKTEDDGLKIRATLESDSLTFTETS
jgi:hypothetical protein